MPLSYDGFIDIKASGAGKRIRIKRVHLEEDAGKLMHESSRSLVDYNRCGMPLLEIVTEPDISSPDEAYEYLSKLKSILKYLRVSDCDMEKGSLRCDANISIRPKGDTKLGTKVELKNMNSFKNVRAGLEFEVKRQLAAIEDKEKIVQETRLWDADKGVTNSMRSKEEAEDYRYFPEPDLVPFMVDKAEIEAVKRALPELPEAKEARLVMEFGLSEYDAALIAADIDTAEYFEEASGLYPNKKAIANWIMGDISAELKERQISIKDLGLSPKRLIGLISMIDSGDISGKMAKDVLKESIETESDPRDVVSRKGLSQVSDRGAIEAIVRSVIAGNEKSVNDYRSGKKNALAFLVGQVMKESKGKANPAIVNEMLKNILGE
jgi:aspartyl-tRNA(Asn)/glutamyl-tRNA(Gln) amidotransferase subunit B